MTRALLFYVPLFFILSGCQHAAWKAGASADDFKHDELSCRTTHNDNAMISQCLRDKGWSLASFAEAADEAAIPMPDSANTAADKTASSPLIENVRSAEQGSSQPSATATPNDPLQQQSVQSWWKAGAQAADFQIDTEHCLTQLGEQHAPNYEKHLYTRALVRCLRNGGWYAGRDPVYTPLR